MKETKDLVVRKAFEKSSTILLMRADMGPTGLENLGKDTNAMLRNPIFHDKVD